MIFIYALTASAAAEYAISPISQATVNAVFLATLTPLTLPASLCVVVGLVGIRTGKHIEDTRSDTEFSTEKLNRLEGIVENNFEVIMQKLDKAFIISARTMGDSLRCKATKIYRVC